MSIDFPPGAADAGGFTWPTIIGGIITPNYGGFTNVLGTLYGSDGWAFPLRIPEDMDVDAFFYITGTTGWSGRKIGVYAFDNSGFVLGAELVAVTGLGPAADTEVTTTFADISLVKDQVVWIAAGGGTGSMKGVEYSAAGIGGLPQTLSNTVGGIDIDNGAAATNFNGAVSLEISANTPAASGALINANTADSIGLLLCGLRRSA